MDMINLLRDFGSLFDLQEKDYADLLKNTTIKIKENGKTLVDIENGIDKLNESLKETNSDKPKKKSSVWDKWTSTYSEPKLKNCDYEQNRNSTVEPTALAKEPKKTYEAPKTVVTPAFESTNPKTENVTTKPYWLRDDVLSVNLQTYALFVNVGDKLVDCDPITLRFTHKTNDDRWAPGITENQLVSILYERFKDDPEKRKIVAKLFTF